MGAGGAWLPIEDMPRHVQTWPIPSPDGRRLGWLQVSDPASIPIGTLWCADVVQTQAAVPVRVQNARPLRKLTVGHPEWIDNDHLIVWREDIKYFHRIDARAAKGIEPIYVAGVTEESIDPSIGPDGEEIIWSEGARRILSTAGVNIEAPGASLWFDPFISPDGKLIGILERTDPFNFFRHANVIVDRDGNEVFRSKTNGVVWFWIFSIPTNVTQRLVRWVGPGEWITDRQESWRPQKTVLCNIEGGRSTIATHGGFYPARAT